MKRLSAFVVFVCAALVGLWAYGFIGFVGDVAAQRERDVREYLESADAIVVLTGGSERVATGLGLLESGNGKKLFISGVGKKLSLEGILKSSTLPQNLRDCCIALGYKANSTAGNVDETRDWIAAEGFTSLRLVTANYHMPRSLFLFRANLPGIKIVPYPVAPDNVKLQEWWRHPGTVSLLATEYGKYLLARAKISIRDCFIEKVEPSIPANDGQIPNMDLP